MLVVNIGMKLFKYCITVFLIIVIVGLFFVFSQKFIFKPKSLTTNDNLIEEEFSSSSSEIAPVLHQQEIIKAVYLTSWSASKDNHIDYIIDIAKTTEINAVVIDIKDFSGYVAYDTAVPGVEKYDAKQIRISDIDFLIQKFHKEGIYIIARITVFQDPVLARARPDLAIHSKSKLSFSPSSVLSFSSLWFDNMELAWIDPAARESWDYNIAIAKDAVEHGFDEINFDYVRFPSDGNLHDMSFPFWDGKVPKHWIIREFYKHLRQELPATKISIDLFGLSTVSSNDLGIGQIIEDAFKYFDYVCPMVYPSHYADGFIGYQNPAEYPYEVVKYSMEGALEKLMSYKQSQKTNVQLRPWLQDFNLGAIYNAEMVSSEIRAVHDALGDNFKGFMLWNSWNIYTKEALQPK